MSAAHPTVAELVREARKSNRQAMLDFSHGNYTRADAERERRGRYMAKARAAKAGPS